MTAATLTTVDRPPSPGTRVAFRHGVLGRLIGTVWKDLGGGKFAIAAYLADFDSHYLFHIDRTEIE